MTAPALPALARLGSGALALADDAAGVLWAEERAERILAGQAGGVAMAQAVSGYRDGLRPYGMHGRVAVLSVCGLIVPSLGYIGSRWATGCAELRFQIAAAVADPDVAGIALRIDSGGGYIGGVSAAVATILAAREIKPVFAACDEVAFSAAYWLASAATEISAPQTGGVGHIGTITTHVDLSRALDQDGVTVTVLHSGARKADGHPYAPLGDEARADVQGRLDALRALFAAEVAAGRRGVIDVAGVLATEARAFDGPAGVAEALTLGLLDAIVTADEALDRFADHLAGAAGAHMETTR